MSLPAMTSPMTDFDISSLSAELDHWVAEGVIATFWWRDDDAGDPCPELDRLLEVSDGRPFALAAIPFQASSLLSARLASEPHVSVFQHGWKHENHSRAGANSEYPAGRNIDLVQQEFLQGSAKLRSLFGRQYAPVFTPPWHGLDDAYLPVLRTAGIRGISSKGRRSPRGEIGLVRNNIHCVPIEWSDPPGFGNPARYVGQLVDHLKLRRNGTDRGEATGILTHHLVQNSDSFAFLRSVLRLIDAHPGARLVDPVELFFGATTDCRSSI
jgi:hypothetical protein